MVLDITSEEKEINEEAAESCSVEIIHIVKSDVDPKSLELD